MGYSLDGYVVEDDGSSLIAVLLVVRKFRDRFNRRFF
jgi:hypothetical protein